MRGSLFPIRRNLTAKRPLDPFPGCEDPFPRKRMALMLDNCRVFEISRIAVCLDYRLIYFLVAEEEKAHAAGNRGDGNRTNPGNDAGPRPESMFLLLFIFTPEKTMVKNAAVWSTIGSPEGGFHSASVARSMGGYAIGVRSGSPGAVQIELKIEVASQLLTDNFSLCLSG